MSQMEERMSIWNSSSSSPIISESNSMVSATLGRVMTTLLTARPKKLNDAVSLLLSSPNASSPLSASLEEALWILHKYVRDSVEKEDSVDHILVPMIENSLKCKDSKHGYQTMILLNWLFLDDDIFQPLVTDFASILLRKDDHYIILGWCFLARKLVEDEVIKEQLLASGTKDKYDILLKILSSCVKQLLSIVCNGSTFQDGFQLPTRLSVAAADCVIAFTIALTRKDTVSDSLDTKRKPSKRSLPNQSLTLGRPSASNVKQVKPTNISLELSSKEEMGLLLWNLLDEVIILVQRLIAWSRKSRYLHAKGLERVLKWLQNTKHYYGCYKAESGRSANGEDWCVALLFLLETLQCPVALGRSEVFAKLWRIIEPLFVWHSDNYAKDLAENKESGTETLNFFLSCLLLLLGRCNEKQFESAMAEFGQQMCRVLVSQLHSSDEDVLDGAVCIIKAAMLRTNSSMGARSLTDTKQMDAIVPLLLHLLDERDGAARAAVMLIAEYCVISSNSQCLEEVLERLAVGNVSQRRNAIDVVSELINMSSNSVAELSHLLWKDISHRLLECLEDKESVISKQASMLLPMINPSFVLPPLVHLVYSANERVLSFACDTLLAVLKEHNKRPEVICLLLDCLSNLCESPNHSDAESSRKAGFKLDMEKVFKMIPDWSESVEDWNILVGPLVDKMLAEPSNATIIRFLSYISEKLADASDAVFQKLLLHARGMTEIRTKEDSVKMQHFLFDRLCPLLIIRLLPLRVFDNLKSSVMYGEHLEQYMTQDYRYFNSRDTECVAALLLNRAFNKFEFDDVRKLAAELCGRIHQHVLCPIISCQLENAANCRDIPTIKACLFAICTALVVRGNALVWHPTMLKIREVIETVLSWPSTYLDEVAKAQHGCIDCLALLVCTELQAPKSSQESSLYETHISGRGSTNHTDKRNPGARSTVQAYVIRQLTCDQNEHLFSSKIVDKSHMFEETLARSFRLCMANVLISACQKISDSGRKAYAKKILPQIIQCVGVMNDSEIKVACIQILFSAVYHLKSVILPYSDDLLNVSVKSLKEGSEKEKMAGAKLMASLMASDELVVASISMGLLEARELLSSISSTDTSPELRLVCQKLLLCMTSP